MRVDEGDIGVTRRWQGQGRLQETDARTPRTAGYRP
jgi:hypothetical protein